MYLCTYSYIWYKIKTKYEYFCFFNSIADETAFAAIFG